MKIVYISNSVIPSRSANSIHVMKMCQAFADQDHEITLLSPRRPDLEEPTDLNVFEFYSVKENFKIIKLFSSPFERLNDFIYCINIFLRLQKLQPEVVYGRFFLGCFVSILLKFKTVFESHNPIWLRTRTEVLCFNSVKNRPAFHRLVVISQALESMYREHFSRNFPLKIHAFHDGADPVDQPDDLVEFSGINAAYFGHLYQGRGVEIIIDLALDFPSVKFHIVGGEATDVEFWKVKSKNCNNLKFYGFQNQASCDRIRPHMDILLAPYQKKVSVQGSNSDTSRWMSPLKIFEYMAAGKAILCSNHRVLQEVLKHDKNCILIEPGNSEGWKSAFSKLLDNKSKREEIGKRARSDFLLNYTWSKRAEKISAIL